MTPQVALGAAASSGTLRVVIGAAEEADAVKVARPARALHPARDGGGISAAPYHGPSGLAPTGPGVGASAPVSVGEDDANWQVLLEDGFEAGFPVGNWRAYRRGQVPYRWEEEAFRARTGTYSVWCVGWSENQMSFPQLDPATDDYPERVETWMVWGPFDASDAEAAVFDFWAQVDTAPGDSLFYGASRDGEFFYGYFESGRSTSYSERSLDIGAALGVTDYSLLDEVWIACYFFSDTSPASGRGVFLDDVSIRKRVPGPICRLGAEAIDFGSVPVDSTSLRVLAIYNDGDRELTGSISVACDPFRLVGDPAVRVSPRGFVERTFEYTPSAEGPVDCQVTIAGSECAEILLGGTGIVYRLPTLSHEGASPVAVGQDVPLVLSLSGEGPPGAPAASVRYLRAGAAGPEWASRDMAVESPGRLTATVPGTDLGLFGSSYYFEFEQGGLSTRLPVGAPGVRFPLRTFATSVQLPEPLPGGGEVAGYRMVSVPGVVADRSALTLLVEDFGAYDDTKWRLFRYDGGTYIEYPSAPADELAPGLAYWVLHREPGQRFDVAAISSQPIAPFQIELGPGWNDVALPFATTLPRSAVRVAGAADGPYTYEGSWRTPASITELDPWTGYSYFNPGTASTTLTLDPMPVEGPGRAPSDPFGGASWRLRLTADSGEARDEDNFLGLVPEVDPGGNPPSFVEPRLVGQGVRLAFPARRRGVDTTEPLLASDFRSEREELSVWPVVLESRVPGSPGVPPPIEVSWQPSGVLPSGWQARIVDPIGGTSFDAGVAGRMDLAWEPGVLVDRLRVIVGLAARVERESEVALLPRAWSARPIGPNPFRGATRIRLELPEASRATVRLHDPTGRRVATPFSADIGAGRHILEWDGADDLGRPLPAGVYFWDVDLGGRSFRARIVRVR